jgi:sugar phosphate isomerase/epimerase
MVTFSSYTNPMDRNYGKSTASDNSTNDVGIGVQDIGMSVPMGIAAANVQGIAAKIHAGAGSLEIGFPGVVRGQRNAQTPGMYGEDQRQAIREMAEITEVKLTTHAAYGIMGFAGMDQQGNFSDEQRKLSVDEIRRAIEFAADTAKGGSVVVHTGEFQRPISEEEWAHDPRNPTGYRFKQYEEEAEKAVIRVVDERTGHVMTQVRKNQDVARPVWLRAKEGYWQEVTKDNEEAGYKSGDKVFVNSGDYVDYEGNPIPRTLRVPEYNQEKGRFKVETLSWDDFLKEAEEMNKDKEKELGRPLTDDEKILPEEAYIKATLETNAANSRGWALYYGESFERYKDMIHKLRKAYKFYKKLEEEVPEEEQWKLKREDHDMRMSLGGLIPPDMKLTSEIVGDKIKEAERGIEQSREASASQESQAREAMETMEHAVSARKYALERSYNSYAEAGMYAFEKTRQKHLEKPLVVTMENIFPESYGGHPDELMSLIRGSREKMADMLHKKGVAEDEAKKLAETHLKATLDTGHLNMWRKYWQDDPQKSIDKNDADFKSWMLKKVEEMAKGGFIGNVHLVDNYGYQDEHLTPGEGNAPVKEIVGILKKHGYKDALTVEPGADATVDLSDFHGLMKTWKLFGSPVYGAHGPVGRTDAPKQSWSNIQYSYFGQMHAPYYIFGSYAPSQDWTMWTQVPLE